MTIQKMLSNNKLSHQPKAQTVMIFFSLTQQSKNLVVFFFFLHTFTHVGFDTEGAFP